MPARSGQEYIASLKKSAPRVYLSGRLVTDVTAEPMFQGRSAPSPSCTTCSSTRVPGLHDLYVADDRATGHDVVPGAEDEQDLVKKRKEFKLRTDHNFGFMGRTMDFMNGLVTGWHLMAERFARKEARFGENAARYYEHVREGDLFLTHMLINPQIDRAKTSAEQEEPFLHLGKVGETREGIVVRGAKMLGTMAPITEEVP